MTTPPRSESGASARNVLSHSTPPQSPFGREPVTSRGRIVFVASLIAVLVLALVIVFVVTRITAHRGALAQPSTAASAGAAPPTTDGGDRARPISLSPADQERIGVAFAPATVGPMRRDVRAVAQVTFDETRVTTIAPKFDGWIDHLYVDATGQPIRAGEPLFSIYSPMLVTAQEELLLAKRLGAEVQQGTSDAVSGASGLLESARRRLQYWDIEPSDVARLERTGAVQKTLVLRSPVTGIVLEKRVLAGQKIMAGEPLYKVADLSTVWVEGQIYEQDLTFVHVGAPVVVEFEALPGAKRAGRIAYIYPTLDAETRTARVRVALSNPHLLLKPGMYATLLVNTTGRTAVLSVPRSAVLETGQRTLVFVQRTDGMLEPRDVVIGIKSDDRAQILSGVGVGEKVVASATFLVDAESNLGSALGGMANMPGMDIASPGGGAKIAPSPAPQRPQTQRR